MATSQPILTLNNGAKIPAVGFGTFANEGAKGQTYKAVKVALETGYRHLDCAWFYENEDEVGDALHEFLDANPSIKRDDIFVCTKVWNHLHEPDEVSWSLETSLKNLRLDYVDLFLVHWPIAIEKNSENMPLVGADGKNVLKRKLTENPKPTWRAMEKAQRDGLTKSIGVSNWTIPGLKSLLKYAEIKPTVNQVEIHPFLPNSKLLDYCISENILPVAYSPLGSQNQVAGTGEGVTTNPDILKVAEKNNVTFAQVLIAWGLKRGYVVLPKSSTPSRIQGNLQLLNLSDEDFATINKIAEGRHTRFVNMKDTFGYDLWAED